MTGSNQLDLNHYVSNLDRNVYTIYNLPEEVIAVIFAYVSRSDASFRENLIQLLQDDELAVSDPTRSLATSFSEKASTFHEKWVVGYGHSSVAEHAVAHIGIEKISRLASAELELATSFNSFTEYSQRYQRPKRGDYYVPSELNDQPELKEAYLNLQEEAYDIYEKLFEQLYIYLQQKMPRNPDESEKRYQLRIEKIAFEDARYALTLATLTNLGMTGNGRSLRDTLVQLLSSPYPESNQLARDMEREISQIIPTLLKYVRPNEYIVESRKKLQASLPQATDVEPIHGPVARILHAPDYRKSLQTCMIHFLISEQGHSYESAEQLASTTSLEELEHVVELALQKLRFFDNPLETLQHIPYQLEMKISEANWHQLLRHNRRTSFTFSPAGIQFGITIPPHIKEAGLSELYERFLTKAETIYRELAKFSPLVASYCVTNGHNRQVLASASLWELYHLINLRTSPEAQWDIQQTFEQIYSDLKESHPVLAKYAQRRLEQDHN
ncbi:FAD-dependent thymidylate synthase [Risungbinella massiliensis]|uniref:FAD-dependent thymidylate synthase n=1 Tax=Risungbinella massiliensis TaxID=1329796 RepID=UPI0005CC88C8|nr:FAD-dependent thymidylate synthase [Risungbinella massiliensis]